MSKVEVYTKINCPECVKVKQHLSKIGIDPIEIPISAENMPFLLKHTRSAPVVFIDGLFVENQQVYNLNNMEEHN